MGRALAFPARGGEFPLLSEVSIGVCSFFSFLKKKKKRAFPGSCGGGGEVGKRRVWGPSVTVLTINRKEVGFS